MVVNISTIEDDSSLAKSAYILDTNIILLLHRIQIDKQSLAGEYSKFISILRDRKCRIIVSALNVQEALNTIERSCWNRYKKGNGHVGRKEYRQIIAEQEKVREEQNVFFSQIKQFYDIEPETITEGDLSKYMDSRTPHLYDPIDYIISEHHRKLGIVTDDTDFVQDDNVTVYTVCGKQ